MTDYTEGTAAGTLVTALLMAVFFILLGWLLKLVFWIFGRGWHAAAVDHRRGKGLIIMWFAGLIPATAIGAWHYLFYLNHPIPDTLTPLWPYAALALAGSLAVAGLALMFTHTQRVQDIADEIRAQQSQAR